MANDIFTIAGAIDRAGGAMGLDTGIDKAETGDTIATSSAALNPVTAFGAGRGRNMPFDRPGRTAIGGLITCRLN